MEIRVQGGTNAGIRRPMKPKPDAWECECREPSIKARFPGGISSRDLRPKTNPGYLVRCPDCRHARPEA